MRLLFAATPIAGHVNPVLSLARMFQSRGDEAVLTTASYLRPLIEASGARFHPLDDAADLDFRHVEDLFPERAGLPAGPAQLKFDMERFFIDPIPAQARTLEALVDRIAPDVIVADGAFLGRIPLFFRDRASRPPIVALGITFLPLPRPDGAPFGLGLPPARTQDERERYADLARVADAEVVEPVRAHLARTLADLGAAGPVCPSPEMMVRTCDAYLQPTVPSFEYDFGTLPPSVRFVGALPPAPSIRPDPPAWWSRLDGSRPVVLVTQGTAANYDFGQLVEPTLEALSDRDGIDVVVTTGGRAVEDVKSPSRPNVFVAPFVDYGELLPRLALLVTNGGYGTVSLALRVGVPIVAVGRSEDKAEVGARVAWSGAGLQIPTQTPSPAELRQAIARVLGEASFRERARAIARDFAATDTQQAVRSIVDGLVKERT